MTNILKNNLKVIQMKKAFLKAGYLDDRKA